MTQIVLNIEDASLVPSLKKIFAAITITRGFSEAKEGRFAGRNLTSLDALVKELKAEA